MYYKQKCPHCGTVKEYVYVQIGHSSSCKNCNYEFVLKKKVPNFMPYVIWAVLIAAAGGIAFYLFRQLHNWWIYR